MTKGINIEYHPENGRAPWWVRCRAGKADLVFARETFESAKEKTLDPFFLKLWNRFFEYHAKRGK